MYKPLESLTEFNSHYSNCYFLLRDKIERETILVKALEMYDTNIELLEINSSNIINKSINVDDYHYYEVNTTYPSLGVINIKDNDTRYISRTPDRQWKKAFNTRNINISLYDNSKYIYKLYVDRGRQCPLQLVLSTDNNNHDFIYDLFFPQYHSISKMEELIEKKTINIAINNKVMVSFDPRLEEHLYLLYYKENMIGYLNIEDRTFSLLNSYKNYMREIESVLEIYKGDIYNDRNA